MIIQSAPTSLLNFPLPLASFGLVPPSIISNLFLTLIQKKDTCPKYIGYFLKTRLKGITIYILYFEYKQEEEIKDNNILKYAKLNYSVYKA